MPAQLTDPLNAPLKEPVVEILSAPATVGPVPEETPPAREDRCWMLSARQHARLEAEIVRKLTPCFAEILAASPARAESQVADAVAAFFPVYARRPLPNNKGGGLINDSLCLYVTARLLAPSFIVESGSYRGHSAWVLRQACPAAKIVSFDVCLAQLRHREAGITYCEGDWMLHDLPAFDPATALVWFDDHINQARRLREARARGFRRALFDDNFPVFNLYATGGVPLPTLAMVMDDSLRDGEEIRWTRHGKTFTYRFDKQNISGCRELVERYIPLPDLTAVTRFSPPSGMTYVEIRR